MNYIESHYTNPLEYLRPPPSANERVAALEAEILLYRHAVDAKLRRIEDMIDFFRIFLSSTNADEAPATGDVLAAALRADRAPDAYGR